MRAALPSPRLKVGENPGETPPDGPGELCNEQKLAASPRIVTAGMAAVRPQGWALRPASMHAPQLLALALPPAALGLSPKPMATPGTL
jgi:hypothetical protein